MKSAASNTRRRPEPIETIRVRRDVWATAKRIADSQPGSLIRIVNERRVEITGLSDLSLYR